jgi:hypothetical protein
MTGLLAQPYALTTSESEVMAPVMLVMSELLPCRWCIWRWTCMGPQWWIPCHHLCSLANRFSSLTLMFPLQKSLVAILSVW